MNAVVAVPKAKAQAKPTLVPLTQEYWKGRQGTKYASDIPLSDIAGVWIGAPSQTAQIMEVAENTVNGSRIGWQVPNYLRPNFNGFNAFLDTKNGEIHFLAGGKTVKFTPIK